MRRTDHSHIFGLHGGRGANAPSHHRDSRHPYTQALLSAVPEANPELAKCKRQMELRSTEIPSLLNLLTGCMFYPCCPYFVPGECDGAVLLSEGIAEGGNVACPVRRLESIELLKLQS